VLYFLVLFALLAGFWLLLSGHWHSDLLLSLGLISSLFAAWIGARLNQTSPRGPGPVLLLRLPAYLVWLTREVVKANIDVVKRIWLPERHPISPAMRRLPTLQQTAIGKTIYANSITLTPGTVAIEVSDTDILVHALSGEALADLAMGEMDRRVQRVESGRR
jgi:multicomponent Na+:H+ antiporter subunit E